MKHFLIVDDKPENLYLLEKFLQGNGYTTITAANGAEALTVALKDPPDIVISDILMPVMDGFTLCREWRKDKKLQKIPFIFYTATYTDPKDEEFALSLGADRFIVKPQDLNDFLKIIKETYNTSRMKTPGPMPVPAPEEKVFLKEYNEALVRKLEKKMTQIEAAEKELREKNAALEKDIVERIQVEEKLSVALTKYKTLFDCFPLGITVSDKMGNIVETNPTAEKLLSMPKDEQIQRDIDSPEWHVVRQDGTPMPPDEYASVRALKEKRMVENVEMGIVKPDNTITWINVTAAPLPLEGHGVVITYNDITERKHAELVLREDEAKTRTILEAISTGILIIDPETHIIVDVNSVAIKLIGESKQKIVGSVCHQYICPAEKQECPITDLRQSIDNSERVLINKEGIRIPILKTAVQITFGGKKFLLENFTDITERKQAEEALHESERKLRGAQEMAQLGYWSWNVKTGDVEWSEQVFKIFRLDPNSFTPHIDSILALSPWPGDHERDEELIRRAIENHEMGFYEQRFLRPDKSIGYYQSTFQGKYDDQGNLTFIIGTIQDITERKQAEEKIREKDIQFRKLSANVSDLIFQFTKRPDGTYCVPIASDGIKNIFGCSPEDVLDDFAPISRVIFPEDSARVISDIEYSAKHLTFFTCEFRVQIPGKAIQWIYSKSNPEKLPDGSITWYGFNTDITERKAAESKLKESEEQYRTLVETMRDGVMQVDNNDIILFVNDSLCKTLGYKREELVGQVGYEVFIHEDDKKKVIQKNKFRTKGKSDNYEVRARKKSGEIIWLNIGGAPVYNHKGSVIGSVGILTDITDRKRTDEALQESEKRYRLISTVASDYMFSSRIGANGDLVLNWVAGAFEQITGYTFKEYVARGGWRATLHPDDLVTDNRDMEKLCANQPVITELRTITKSGNTLWVRIYAHPVWDTEQEKLVGISGAVQNISERKQAEEELRFRDVILSTQQETSIDGILVVNEEGKIISYNNQFVKMWDIPPKLVEKKTDEPVLSFVAKMVVNPQPFLQRVQHLYKHKQETSQDEIILKNGSIFDRYSAPMIGPNDQYYGRVWYFRDITKRKQAEDLLAKERNLLRTLIDALPDRIFVKDIHGKFLLNNVTHLKALGAKSQEDTFGKTDHDFRSKEYSDRYSKSDRQVLQTGKPIIGMEEQSISASGESGWILSNKVPLRDSQGNIVGLVGNSSDITALKRAEQNIRMLSLAIEQSPVSIVITDLEGKIEYVNPKFTQLTGYTFSDALGQNPNILKSGEKPADEYKQLWEAITSGKEWQGEFHNKKKNGELYWEYASISPIKDGSGKITHYLAVKEDITERKLLQSQLLRSQRIESIGTLAGGVAHDLNNVLAPILLSIDLLRKTIPDKRSQKMLETLETSALRGSAIVKQILGFARGVRGESVLIQIRHIINEMVNIIKETFPKSITMKEDIPKNIWTIVGDPTNLHQVILNLCVNARDAMPDGGTISIKAENKLIDEQYARMNIEAKLGQYVMLSVEDTGCGIPPKVLEHIFEPFFTTKEIGKGTGLGLSTVHSIVKNHDGFINVYSEVGKGTTFRVYLPAAKESGDIEKELKKSLNMFMGHEELILVVDDEYSIQQITKNTLEVYGYRTLTASDGTEAIAQFASRKDEVALVLTDMIMPVMDGQKTIQVLRKMNPKIKIIASSGLAGKNDVVVEKGLAVDAFLVKPYNAEKLLETVYSVLHKK